MVSENDKVNDLLWGIKRRSSKWIIRNCLGGVIGVAVGMFGEKDKK